MRLDRLAVLAAAFGFFAAAQARAIDPCSFIVCGNVPPVLTLPEPPPLTPPPQLAKGPSTHLLFPFVINQAGFDTVLTIANSSMDPFGTATPDGSTCVLYFFGSNARDPVTVPLIAPGTTTEEVVSTLAPTFEGYVIADCDFPRGHGFAAVTDLGARNLAAGYPALVIPPGKRKAGEALSQ